MILGSQVADYIWVQGTLNQEVYGGRGDDTISLHGGDDYARGGGGNDVIVGSSGTNEFHGSFGNDILWGGEGPNMLFGDKDDDQLFDIYGGAELTGGPGRD